MDLRQSIRHFLVHCHHLRHHSGRRFLRWRLPDLLRRPNAHHQRLHRVVHPRATKSVSASTVIIGLRRTCKPRMNYFYPLAEYLRPWKLFSLACGIALLIIGAYWYRSPDWDIPISFIMAVFTYFTAP